MSDNYKVYMQKRHWAAMNAAKVKEATERWRFKNKRRYNAKAAERMRNYRLRQKAKKEAGR
jgi:ribosomal 30S subunit maturation factor RimM